MTKKAAAAVEPDVLQDRVFIVSLVSVLTDAFGTAKYLYHRLKLKSTTIDHDHGEHEKPRSPSRQDRRDSHSYLGEAFKRHVRWSLDRRDEHRSDSEGELICNASQKVQATYDRGYRKLGEAYARGDSVAKIQLQSHIIKLQQVMIQIHQDLMLSNYLVVSSSHSQLIHLVQTVRTTRAAAIQALDLLLQRLLANPPKDSPKPPVPMPGAFPKVPRSRRSSSSNSSSSPSDSSTPAPSKPPINPNPNINDLFCRYALDLQTHSHLPPSLNFAPGGTNRCPSCHTSIPIRPRKAWEVIVDNPGRRPVGKRFLVKNRFVVKCHRPRGGYACVLCAHYSSFDTVCLTIRALMEHLWKEHSCSDMSCDSDIIPA